MSGADRETEGRANELYWTSDLSVNQIAEELDLSKGMLYELIRPAPAGMGCPECSEELVYANRTARDRALLACPRCGWEGDEDDVDLGVGDHYVVVPDATEGEAAVAPGAATTPDAGRKRVMVGGALLGAAAGLALVLWSRRR
jgi:hypothetical protein